jgi:hypothetical protein
MPGATCCVLRSAVFTDSHQAPQAHLAAHKTDRIHRGCAHLIRSLPICAGLCEDCRVLTARKPCFPSACHVAASEMEIPHSEHGAKWMRLGGSTRKLVGNLFKCKRVSNMGKCLTHLQCLTEHISALYARTCISISRYHDICSTICVSL